MSAAWFGELYLETTAPLLTPGLTRAEAAVIASLLRLAPGERVLDLGCGHGRHLAALAGRGLGLWGVDLEEADFPHRVAIAHVDPNKGALLQRLDEMKALAGSIHGQKKGVAAARLDEVGALPPDRPARAT